MYCGRQLSAQQSLAGSLARQKASLNVHVARRRLGSLEPCPRAVGTAAAGSSSGSGSNGAVVVLPGFLFSSRQYTGLVEDLRRRGFDTEVVPMGNADWLPVLGGGSFEFYLDRLDSTLKAVHARHGEQVALVGHSAGGWIARILLGNEPYQGVRYGRSAWVHTLLTLGSPHQSIENYPFGRAEESLEGPNLADVPPGVSGSSLQFANFFYPDSAALGNVRVVCACGNAIHGRPLWGDSSSGSSSALPDSSSSGGSTDDAGTSGSSGSSSRWDAYFAYESYKSGCGRGDVDGDGVTPLCIAQLPGAEQLVLPGVWHSARRKAGQLWYGDSAIVDQWQQFLLQPHHSQVQ